MNTIRIFFSLIFFICSQNAIGQFVKTINKSKTDTIYFDEQGKVKGSPSFTKITNKPFNFNIVVDAPTVQHKEFIKNLSKKLLDTYKMLNDTANENAKLNKIFFGESFDTLKNDFKELGGILASDTPKADLVGSPNNFESFHGKPFLIKTLFDSVFTVKAILPSQTKTKTFPYNSPNFILIKDSTKEEEALDLRIIVTDFEKAFIKSYYEKSKTQAAPQFDSINKRLSEVSVEKFYKNVKDSLGYLGKELDILMAEINSSSQNIVCDSHFDRYQNLKLLFHNQYPISLLYSGWMKNTVLLTGGGIKVNPLNFTDEEYFYLEKVSDTVKTPQYNQYRNNIIKMMLASKDLNEASINYKVFDSLLSQSLKGKELFNNKADIEKKTKENTSNASQFQLIDFTKASNTFSLIKKNERRKYKYVNYDARNKLKGSIPDEHPTLSNKVKVFAVAYNLKQSENFKLEETPVEINNFSSATEQINEVANGLSLIASPLPGALKATNYLTKAFKTTNGIKPYNIGGISKSNRNDIYSEESNKLKKEKGFRTLTQSPADSGKVKKYIVQFSGNELELLIRNNKNTKYTVYNITKQFINERFKAVKVDECSWFSRKLNENLKPMLSTIQKRLNSVHRDNENDAKVELISFVDERIKKLFNDSRDHWKGEIQRDLEKMIVIVNYINNAEVFMLPPIKIKVVTDTVPSYRNKRIVFAAESKAVRKDVVLSLVNTKSGEVINKKKESYKTAPTYRVSPSIGATYIFNEFRRSDATISNGAVVNTADEDQIRLIAGLHFYPFGGGLVRADDHSMIGLARKEHWKEFFSRFGVFTGVSFPKPVYNLHFGASVDFWTGVKISGGSHFYRYTSYTLMNNQIIDQKSRYIHNQWFISLSIDPVSVGKLVGIF